MRREQSEHSALFFFLPSAPFMIKIGDENRKWCWSIITSVCVGTVQTLKTEMERGKREKMRWTSVSEASGRAV